MSREQKVQKTSPNTTKYTEIQQINLATTKSETMKSPKKKGKPKKKLSQTNDNNNKSQGKDVTLPENDKLIATVDIEDEAVYVMDSYKPDNNNNYFDRTKQWISKHKIEIIIGGAVVTVVSLFVTAYLFYLLFSSKNNINNQLTTQEWDGFDNGFNHSNGTFYRNMTTPWQAPSTTKLTTESTTTKVTPTTTKEPFDNAYKTFYKCLKSNFFTPKHKAIKTCLNQDLVKSNCKEIVEKIITCNNSIITSDNFGQVTRDQAEAVNRCILGAQASMPDPYYYTALNLIGSVDDYCIV